MRQTPFGVWNSGAAVPDCRPARRCNEADAFRRLEPGHVVRAADPTHGCNEADAFRRLERPYAAAYHRGQIGCNEADAFRRLELGETAENYRVEVWAAMRQTPFGVWNERGRAGRIARVSALQ